MAEAWLATAMGPQGFQKKVVLKVIAPRRAQDNQFVRMFVREASLAAQLNHPNVVQVFDFGKRDGTYFIAMEYVPGFNLRQIASRAAEQRVALPLGFVAGAVVACCRGLSHAHGTRGKDDAHRIIHRDVTSENIIVSDDGITKLIDFGIAATAGEMGAEAGVVKGKPAYLAPELVRGRPIDPRCDIYSLGVVLYELLTGQRPFGAQTGPAVLRRVVNEGLPSIDDRAPHLPLSLREVVRRATSIEPTRRPESASAFLNDLKQACVAAESPPHGPEQMADFVSALFEEPCRLPSSRMSTDTTSAPASSDDDEVDEVDIDIEFDLEALHDELGLRIRPEVRSGPASWKPHMSDIFAVGRPARRSSERTSSRGYDSGASKPSEVKPGARPPSDPSNLFDRQSAARKRPSGWPAWVTSSDHAFGALRMRKTAPAGKPPFVTVRTMSDDSESENNT